MSNEETDNTTVSEDGNPLPGVGGRYLCFSLGDEEFGIPINTVKEVIVVPEITHIPRTPAHFMGILNLRGQVISAIDLCKKMQIKPHENNEETIIICDLGTMVMGVKVDSVNAVLTPDKKHVSSTPKIESAVSTEYIQAVYRKDDRLLLFLDIARVLDADDVKAIKKNGARKVA